MTEELIGALNHVQMKIARLAFFRHYETDFFSEIFFSLFLPSIFDILQQKGCSKIPKRPPFTFFDTMRLTGSSKKFEKNRIFFSIFSFLRAFVVSSFRKSGFCFRVFLRLRYGADLGRSRLVTN